MEPPPDHRALMDGLQALADIYVSDGSGLAALTQLLATAGTALPAAGMSLSEHHQQGGRVVVATGAVSWAEGLPVCESAPSDPPTREIGPDALGDELATQLRGRGLHRVVGARVPRPGGPDGLLCAYFADPDPPPTGEHHAMLRFLGSCAAALYAGSGRLPVAAPPPATVDRDLFLAVASHELRTPVTVIKGFADTLDQHWETLDPAARRDAVRVVRQRAADLAHLVDRLLTTAVDADSPPRGPFDLRRALYETVDGMGAPLRQRLRVSVPAELPRAHGDRRSIPPVLTELVTNAAKYSTGEVELEAGADEQTVLIRVADRGDGIDPEHVERAFTRYWQVGAGDRQETAGAGLGLHLVRRIVERQNGWVSLRPRRSGGTVAEVRLLRTDASVTDESGQPREA